jgi:hypothetical protein
MNHENLTFSFISIDKRDDVSLVDEVALLLNARGMTRICGAEVDSERVIELRVP